MLSHRNIEREGSNPIQRFLRAGERGSVLQWNLSIWTLENVDTCVNQTPSHGPESHPIYLYCVCICDLWTLLYSEIRTAMCGPTTLTQYFYNLRIVDRRGQWLLKKFLVQPEVSYFKCTFTMNVEV